MAATGVRRRPSPQALVVGIVLLSLLLVGIWLLHSNEVKQRDSLDRLFTARAETSAQFLQTYTQDVFSRNLVLANTEFQGNDFTQADLDKIALANGIEAFVLLDGSGRLLTGSPAAPKLVGTDMGSKYPHLGGAVAGVPTASNVVLSAVRKVPIVAFALPFDTRSGRRVFSAAYDIQKTPLASYLAHDIGHIPEASYVVDAKGDVVSRGGSESVAAKRLVDVDPALSAAADQPGSSTISVADDPWRVVTVPLVGTPWRLITATPTARLYASINPADLWLARAGLFALAIGGLVMVGLLERIARQRTRLSDQETEATAVLDGTVDAFVSADESGRIVAWNPAAEGLFGWTRTEALGRPFASLLVTEELWLTGGGEADGGTATGTWPALPVELTARRSDGQEVPVELTVSRTLVTTGSRTYAFFRDIRPRRLAEQRTQMLAQMAESAGDAMYSRDLDGRMISWNASAERLLGWTEAESVGQGLDHPMVGAHRADMLAMIRAVVATQVVQYEETARFSRSGVKIEIGLTCAPLLDQQGELVGVSEIARDIGERKRLEEELRHSEAVFRSAFDDALLGMCLTSLDGRFLRVNSVFAGFLGRSADELVGTALDAVTHPDYVGRSALEIQQTLAGGQSGYRDEMCFVAQGGTQVWADVSVSLVRDKSGAPIHFVTQVVDVTARRAALQERDSRDAMLAAVIANSQSLIYIKDLDGRYLLANEPFALAFGVSEEELLGRDDVFLQPNAMPTSNAPASNLSARHLDQWSDAADGRHLYESVIFPLHDHTGRLYGFCGVCLDVTEQRQASAVVALARDEALAATAAKSAFLATMSHEIRTPMNAVIGMTGLLLDTDLDSRQREFVETVRVSGDALLVVINDILDYSKIESGQLELEQQSFSLTEAVEGCVDLMAVAATNKGLDLVCYLEQGCPSTVLGDQTRLRQVLVNLLSNAVKFTPSGDVLLTVAAASQGEGHHLLTFTITDTGIGIPADRMNRLFRSFSQVDDSTTRVYGGTGLGLAISTRLVQAMGGELKATSVSGVGSTFAFSVPFATQVASVEPATAVTQQGVDATLAGRRVLLVDDNSTNLKILSLQLTAREMICTAVQTPAAALELLRDGFVCDLAVLDMHMPVMDGVGLATAIRELPIGARLPLVLLTSLGDPPSGGSNLFARFMTKPVKSAVLLASLAAALGTGSAQAAPRRAVNAISPREKDGRRLRVLLVEDNTVNQKVAQLMLKKLGHAVDTVGDGQEAVQAMHSAPYDVILMDLQMPVMDGLEATRRIRSQVPLKAQPYIVAMTASVLVDDRTACTAAGMDWHLAKPVREAEMRDSLDRVPVGASS